MIHILHLLLFSPLNKWFRPLSWRISFHLFYQLTILVAREVAARSKSVSENVFITIDINESKKVE